MVSRNDVIMTWLYNNCCNRETGGNGINKVEIVLVILIEILIYNNIDYYIIILYYFYYIYNKYFLFQFFNQSNKPCCDGKQ